MWPFASKGSQSCFYIGNYRLGADITSLAGLIELASEEIIALNRAVQFKGERLYHAPPADFLAQSWDIVLGTVHGKIYKIALQLPGLTRSDGGAISRAVLAFVTKQQRRRPRSDGPLSVWDASDGNIVFHDAWLGNSFTLNVFLTSREVRKFQRL